MTAGSWALVVPVKHLARAKTRLSDDPRRRARLALAMASDTVAAAVACVEVAEVVVATDDPEVQERAIALGAHAWPDPGGLNEALAAAAAHAAGRWPGLRVAALAADLPALTPADLALALRACGASGRWCVGDAGDHGTTLLAAAPGGRLEPAFGGASWARHRAGGATPLEAAPAGLRRDVDTEAELAVAVALGVGPHTRAALAGPAA